MTMHRLALAGLLALTLAACSGRQEPPAAADAASDAEEEIEPGAMAPAAPEPAPNYDYPKLAEGMLPLLASKPECQRFHDEMRAIIEAPAGTAPARDPALIVAEAHDAGCSTKSQPQ